MAFERTKILTTFAIFGFFIGSAAYFILHWFVTNNLIKLLDVFVTPWFVSGIIGAVLSLILVIVFAQYSTKK